MTMPSSTAKPARRLVRPVLPYRLDLTVAVLRRFSTNVVDRTDERGRYLRVLAGDAGPVVLTAAQTAPDAVEFEIEAPPAETARVFALARRLLGVDRDISGFYERLRRPAWLRGLAERMRGMKPPRYATLWEACVNAIVFQQVSLHAATAILRRTIEALVPPLEHAGMTLLAFPTPAMLLAADDAPLRAAGLSSGKLATLRRVAEALGAGALDEAALEERDTPAAIELLCEIKGIGPWTAAVIMLRGLGRLDIFPLNDSGAARSLAVASGHAVVDLEAILKQLGEWRGLLYYHLLLARLEERGEVGAPTALLAPEKPSRPTRTRPAGRT
jgi:DNA-3-methyladenine glycosylase II